jgi:hypothetical protein
MFLIGRKRIFELVLLGASSFGADLAQANDLVKDYGKAPDCDERAQRRVNADPKEHHHIDASFDHRIVEIPQIPEILGK